MGDSTFFAPGACDEVHALRRQLGGCSCEHGGSCAACILDNAEDRLGGVAAEIASAAQ